LLDAEPLWPDGVGDAWLDALRLPTLAWARPLLPLLGLPPAVVRAPEALEPVHQQALADRQALLEATAVVEPSEGLDGAITREVVIRAMHRLAGEVGEAAGAAFERWTRTHLVSHDITRALFAWRMILLRFLRAAPADADPPPQALMDRRDQLDEILDPARSRELDDLLSELAPPPGEYERELGLAIAADALAIKEIVWNRWTLEGLEELGTTLSEPERNDVAAWVSRQARAHSEGAEEIAPAELLRFLPPGDVFAGVPPAVSLPIPAITPEDLAAIRPPPPEQPSEGDGDRGER
jgi:hypothetical protein